eukprot:Pgem_evm2s4698
MRRKGCDNFAYKKDGMVNVKNWGLRKIANYAPNKPKEYCSQCKLKGMENDTAKRRSRKSLSKNKNTVANVNFR